MEAQQKDQDPQKDVAKSQKDVAKHLNEIKWIIVCGIIAALFLFSTEPVVPGAEARIQSICANQRGGLPVRTQVDCVIYDLFDRVLKPDVL
jgi:hypothetical protein